MKRVFWALVALFATLPSFGGITYTCDSSLSATNGFPADICAMLNGAQAAGVYDSIFSNVTANIFVQYAGVGLASSSTALNSIPYSTYLADLSAESNSSAWQSLSSTEPSLYGGDQVAISSALANALGVGGPLAGVEADGVTPCVLGSSGCYNGVLEIGFSALPLYFPLTPYDSPGTGVDFFSLVEHETDEILGTISCLGTNDSTPYVQCFDSNGNTYVAPADLFRYSAPGTLSWLSTADGSTAYFSINNGATAIAYYNNTPNGDDYGDWTSNCTVPLVQDTEPCGGANVDLTTDGGAEIQVLNAVGFNLIVPEPATTAFVGLGLVVLAARRLCRR